jgi:flagellar biosynthesis/type III secretory pathway chaperone
MKRVYKNNLQQIITAYKALVPTLSQNSSKRISINQNYQNFLSEIKKKEPDYESLEASGKNDVQLEETFNVMKDFIFIVKH